MHTHTHKGNNAHTHTYTHTHTRTHKKKRTAAPAALVGVAVADPAVRSDAPLPCATAAFGVDAGVEADPLPLPDESADSPASADLAPVPGALLAALPLPVPLGTLGLERPIRSALCGQPRSNSNSNSSSSSSSSSSARQTATQFRNRSTSKHNNNNTERTLSSPQVFKARTLVLIRHRQGLTRGRGVTAAASKTPAHPAPQPLPP